MLSTKEEVIKLERNTTMTKEDIGKQLCSLIIAYWTPARIELWHEYEKTDRSVTWREYEHAHKTNNQEYKESTPRKER